mmetsp:Transcript_17292/g.28130  ORF Transcript_17292/g.28130 Transcript_17292/m.28130 type:complete len:523 (-) Transcript_17292:330-1898(-)
MQNNMRMDVEPEDFSAPRIDGKSLGQYTLKARLGQGATAITYQAEKKNGEKVALKVQWVKRDLGIEIKALEEMKDCDYAVKFLKLTDEEYTHRRGEKSTVAVMALELCPNGTLYPYLRHRSFSLKLVQGYFAQLCSALEYMKKKKVIHRDIKPDNILLGENWDLKMADFGFSVIGEEAKGRAGTTGYMAPEVDNYAATGESYCRKIDIYSSGVVLFVMLYGWKFGDVPNAKRNLINGNKRGFWNKQLRWILQRRGNTLRHVSRGEELLFQRIAGLKTEEYPIVITYSLNKKDPQVCYDIRDVEMVVKKANRVAEAERIQEDSIVFEVHKIPEMDLLDGMLENDPTRRWDIEEIKMHPFYQEGSGFTPSTLEEELEKKWKDIEKKKDKGSQKEKESITYAQRTRSTGDDDSDEFSVPFSLAKFPELPSNYDQISMDEKKRVNYLSDSAVVKCHTVIKYDYEPEDTLAKLVAIFEDLWKANVTKDIENYTIRVKCDKEKFPKVNVLITVFEDKDKEDESIIEFR